MANQNITFDVASGTPYESNLTINGGANFSNIFTVTNPNGTAFNFTDYSGSSQMIKSVGVGATNLSGLPSLSATLITSPLSLRLSYPGKGL